MALPPGMILGIITQPLLLTGFCPLRKTCNQLNKILSQALRNDVARRLLVIGGCRDQEEEQEMQKKVSQELDVAVEKGQIIVRRGSAKIFLETSNLAEELRSLIPKAEDEPF